MNKLKKIIVYLLIMVLMVTNMSTTFAATTSLTQNGKATILNSLGVLRGDGISFDLDSQLKRSEAATFIVRLIGKESEVLSNKTKYSDVDFTDVNATDWYAPYVGYCKEAGIIDGFVDNTFRANDYVSEKAFLKLLLAALGYEYNVDFNWNTVYASAYNLGIVKGERYKVIIDDNTNYLRGQVVEAIYETLKTEHKETEERMIQYFINALIISKSDAIEYGLIDDDIETELVSFNIIDEKTLKVVFNENITVFTDDNLVIYEKERSSNTLGIEDIYEGEEEYSYLITLEDEQEPDTSYSMILSDVIDAYGNKSNTFHEDFLGFRPDELISDFFMISKVEAVSNSLIHLYFTQPLNDIALQANLYEITKDDNVIVEGTNTDLILAKLADCENGISLYAKNYTFNEDDIYALFVSGDTTSQYGVRLKDGEGDSIKFNGSSEENEVFELDDIDTLNKNTIELSFNQAINEVLAEQVYMYYLTTESGSPIQITEANVTADNMAVRLTTSNSLSNESKYNIMINNITDVTRQFSITEKSYDFEVIYSSSDNVEIETVFSIDAGTIMLYVDRPLDVDTATDASNYQIYGVTSRSYMAVPSAVYYDKSIDAHLVKIYLPENKILEDDDRYELKMLTSIKDEMGNKQTSIQKKTFSHNNKDITNVKIADARIVGENTIKLTFNKEIALDVPNVLSSNYQLSYTENGTTYKKSPIGANYINPTTLILKFDSLDAEKLYEVTFESIIDYGGIETDNSNGEYSKEVVMGE